MNQRDRESQVARMLERRRAVLEKLQALPNVRSVGVGLRVRRGKPTAELAFRVYVDVKVPRAKLAPADLIPEVVEGIPTDVLQIGRARKLCWSKGTRPLVGGVEIGDSPFDTFSMKSGTLGCIVTTADGKMAALSNEHVLRHKMHLDKRVYQPLYDDCLGFECNKIGQSIAGLEDHFEHEGTSFWTDCAIAILDSGIGRRFRLRRVIHKTVELIEVAVPAGVEGKVWINQDGKVVAISDQAGNPIDRTRIGQPGAAVPGTLVWKVGNRTGLTVGIVDDPMGPVTDDVTGETNNNVILVRALAGYENNDIPMFADEGDSGSILLDLSNRVLGIVTGIFRDETDDGEKQIFTYACNIDPVLAFLKATINESPSPAGPTGAIVEEQEESSEVDLGERLHAFQRRVGTTSSGRVLIALIERHAAEAYDLATRRRAVKVTWHRKQGPAFAARLARALRDSFGALPAEANEVPLQSMLSAMGAVLRQHGSPRLRADLDAYEPWIIGLLDGCGSLEELLSRLEASSPALSR